MLRSDTIGPGGCDSDRDDGREAGRNRCGIAADDSGDGSGTDRDCAGGNRVEVSSSDRNDSHRVWHYTGSRHLHRQDRDARAAGRCIEDGLPSGNKSGMNSQRPVSENPIAGRWD